MLALLGCTWIDEAALEARLGKDNAPATAEVNPDDLDGDGHEARDAGGDDCWDDPSTVPEGYSPVNGFSALAAAEVNPSATDRPYDGIDADCDGASDFDQDGDGHDIANVAYGPPDGAGDDCYDSAEVDAYPGSEEAEPTLEPVDVYPGAEDAWYDGTDADCAGNDDYDQDGDGFPRDLECDDLDASRFPDTSLPERWYDGVDDNCDGNDGDQDGDGYYADDYAYEVPSHYVARDCWDDPTEAWSPLNGLPSFEAAEAWPGAADTWYDGLDQDCGGDDDFDQDGDGFRADDWPDAEGAFGEDCEDTLLATNPDASEDCATEGDDDCDGSTNAVGAAGCADWYADQDRDGYGSTTSVCQCEAAGVYTADESGDCDDGSASVRPAGTETCNSMDDDCDGAADEGLPLYYTDADGDSYGAGAGTCSSSGRVSNADDCDDTNEMVYPGAAEHCDGIANDCDTEASWTEADEDQLVSFVDGTTGAWSDVSSDFNLATAVNVALGSGTYYLCTGTYYTKLVALNDTTDVVGVYGADLTTLDNNASGAAGPTVSITSGTVTLSGLTITGGEGSGSSTTYGGGIIATAASAPSTPTLVVEDCVVTANVASNGGGVAAYSYGWIRLVRTTVEGNVATNGGGLYAMTNADLSLEDTTVQDNTATSDGGGVYVDDGTLDITDSYVINNTAEDGGGVFVDTGTVTCSGGGIYGNSAADKGGGVYLSNYNSTTASFTAVSCDFGTGATDNDPNDVEIKTGGTAYTAYSSYTSTATFVCTNASDVCL